MSLGSRKKKEDLISQQQERRDEGGTLRATQFPSKRDRGKERNG